MEVNLQKVADALNYFREINNTKLEDIHWMYAGQEIKLDKEFIEEWKYIGLSNREIPSQMGWINQKGNITL